MQGLAQKLTLILLVLLALVPTVNIFPWFAPPSWGQAVLVRLLVPLLGLLFVARLASTPGFAQQAIARMKAARWILASFVLFLGVYALALLFSQDPHFSFWGNPDRAWGALNYGLYVVLGLIAFLSLTKEEWKKVWLTVFAGAAFLALIAFSQSFALFPQLIAPATRAHGTLGNPLLLGAYLAPLVFLLLGFALRIKRLQRSWTLAAGFGTLALVLFLAAFFTGSRSALLGMGAGTLFFLFFVPVRTRLLRVFGMVLGTAGIVALVFLFLYPTPPAFLPESFASSWKRITPQNILEAIEEERIAGWRVELQGIMDRPLLGYGPYNSFVGFNRHFDPILVVEYADTGWWDTAHSMYLDIAAGTGMLGLVAFLAFLGALFWGLRRSRETAPPQEKLLLHGTQAALLAYLVAMIPSFNSPATYLLFFLLIGYAFHLISTSSPLYLNRISTLSRRFTPYLLGIFGVFLLFFIYTTAIKPLVVNKEINLAVQEAEAGRCQEALGRTERSFPKNSHFADYHRLMEVEIIGKCLGDPSQNAGVLSRRAVELERIRTTEHPLRPRAWILLGSSLNNLILFSQDAKAREQLANEAVIAFQNAQELSPQRFETYAGWIRTERFRGNYQKAKELAAQCLVLSPSGQCAWEHLLTSIASGDYSPSLHTVLKETKEYQGIGYKTKSFYVQLARAYAARPELHYPQLREIYLYLTEIEPDNIRYHAALAAVYRELGEREKAIQQLQEMWRLSPTPEMQQQINAFLQTL